MDGRPAETLTGLTKSLGAFAVASARACSARLVALSGCVPPEDVHRATEAGFDHHLAKPFDLDKLRALLRA
jgi:CheY-like chemotaxis protein